jgi:hypothetical protein
MDDFIEDIEFSVQHRRWLLALAGALALPDICAAMQSQNGQTTGSKYKNWVRTHLADTYPRLDPDEMYRMRCSLLHQGTSSTIKYSRIIFLGPDSNLWIHNGLIEHGDQSVLVLDLPTFCSDVIAAVNAWREAVKETANYRRNIDTMMRWRPEGIDPFIVGDRVLT